MQERVAFYQTANVGSGYVISSGLVITAAHVDRWQVRYHGPGASCVAKRSGVVTR